MAVSESTNRKVNECIQSLRRGRLDQFATLPLNLQSLPFPHQYSRAVHLTIEPLSIIGVPVAEIEQSPTMLFAFFPSPPIKSAIMIFHGAMTRSIVVFPLALVRISIFVLIYPFSMFFVSQPIAFIALAVGVDVGSSAFLSIFLPSS